MILSIPLPSAHSSEEMIRDPIKIKYELFGEKSLKTDWRQENAWYLFHIMET